MNWPRQLNCSSSFLLADDAALTLSPPRPPTTTSSSSRRASTPERQTKQDGPGSAASIHLNVIVASDDEDDDDHKDGDKKKTATANAMDYQTMMLMSLRERDRLERAATLIRSLPPALLTMQRETLIEMRHIPGPVLAPDSEEGSPNIIDGSAQRVDGHYKSADDNRLPSVAYAATGSKKSKLIDYFNIDEYDSCALTTGDSMSSSGKKKRRAPKKRPPPCATCPRIAVPAAATAAAFATASTATTVPPQAEKAPAASANAAITATTKDRAERKEEEEPDGVFLFLDEECDAELLDFEEEAWSLLENSSHSSHEDGYEKNSALPV